jgi:hypothetical protein
MNGPIPAPDPITQLRNTAGHLQVHCACDRTDWIGDAVLDIAAGDRINWTPSDWRTLLQDLRRSPGTLTDWLDLNT